MNNDQNEVPPLENLLLAALYLATSYTKSNCPLLSRALLHQLQYVMRQSGADVHPAVRETCQRLHDVWEGIHAQRALALAREDAYSITRRVH